jgi:hypothetical protein
MIDETPLRGSKKLYLIKVQCNARYFGMGVVLMLKMGKTVGFTGVNAGND